MIDGQFDVIFRGQTIKNRPLDEVKANLVKLFKSSPEAVEKLFSGDEVTIKKSLDYTTAMKYQSALKKAGALALIKEVEKPESAQSTAPQTPATSQGRASFGVTEPQPESHSPQPQPQPDSARVEANSAQNVSSEQPPAEKIAEVVEPSDGNMTLAAAGARILPNKVYEKREVDTSELSLANVGERILPKKPPETHPQPSIDHLKLEN